jgi:hypothetical protein
MPEASRAPFATRASTLPRTLLIALITLVVGLGVYAVDYVERQTRDSAAELLDSRLQQVRRSLVLWTEDERLRTATWAGHPTVVRIGGLLEGLAEAGVDARALRARPEFKLLDSELGTVMTSQHDAGYAVFDTAGGVIAGSAFEPVGTRSAGPRTEFVRKVMKGEAAISAPFRSQIAVSDNRRCGLRRRSGTLRAGSLGRSDSVSILTVHSAGSCHRIGKAVPPTYTCSAETGCS